ncbi:DUF947-domain-containing protein [Pseudovirgaria hyperparasitica]|uniref:rRNA biogenesis protein RRP36 n=1 Tax=Pseudovirgaria hyperparasitica TaxID=470096 RepID=A0A6A6VZL1_9PEZI|nr:DUF947-domain-containing protein [Pseudovirgaria hyperparasitica]KAF2755184.1 DUF947-domain-containing protein [Pseudovirgaria hyperparasitica]
MVLSKKLSRSIKPRTAEEYDSDPHSSELDVSSPSILDTGEDREGSFSASEAGSDLTNTEEEDEDNAGQDDEADEDAQERLSKVSFGSLAKAQAALFKDQQSSRKRKRGAESSGQQEDKLLALRKRLLELKSMKSGKELQPLQVSAKQRRRKDEPDTSDDSQDSDDEDEDGNDDPRKRSSKHAPAIQSSKKPVTRRRTVLETHKRVSRDPRFDPLSGPPKSSDSLSRKYAFLKDYRADEIAELKNAQKKSKDATYKEDLKKQITSMENRAKAQAAKDKEQEVKREHRKKEKEAIEHGKKPFYLKRSEIKQQALVEKYNSMNAKSRDKLMQRRRKKLAGKEKKQMPRARRTM